MPIEGSGCNRLVAPRITAVDAADCEMTLPRARKTEPEVRLPADLVGPVSVELARSVETIPGPSALPGGSRYEPKWDGYLH
jgi:hypothetical protein